MALYSGISVMMTLLTFATLLGLAIGLKCYRCPIVYSKNDGEHNDPYDVCEGKKGKLDQEKMNITCDYEGFACFKETASWPDAAGVVRGCAKIIEGYEMGCSNEVRKEFKREPDMKMSLCYCDTDFCNGGRSRILGSDVNVILGFGVTALILGYLRQ